MMAAPVVIALTGELDLASAADLRDRLLEALEPTGSSPAPQVLVDLSGVKFMDAASLGMIAAASARCEAAGGEMRVRNANPAQRRLFRLFGLERLLDEAPPAVPQQARPANGSTDRSG